MQRDVRAYLSDIEQAGRDIVDFTGSATLEECDEQDVAHGG
jgi:uncharacterized protein with HEPN domain